LKRLAISVDGIPQPQGSMRLFKDGAGNAYLTSANSGLGKWRAAIVQAVKDEDDQFNLTGPAHISVDFFLPKPPTVKRLFPSVKPDVDKLLRAVFDALEASGALSSDAIICGVEAKKHYAGASGPGAEILLREY
jgi:crossover junction endodeoxyribonuclease RusA